MNEIDIEREVQSAKKSMEIEGFLISDDLVEQGRKILRKEVNIDDVVAKYIRESSE